MPTIEAPRNYVDAALGPLHKRVYGPGWMDRLREGPHMDFERRFHTYLTHAQELELTDSHSVDACEDLALTLTSEPERKAQQFAKINRWISLRQQSLERPRPPREIILDIAPEHFVSVEEQRKTFEGRAFDPASSKQYQDLRYGDSIILQRTGSTEQRLAGTVGRVYFAPLVHWMFQFSIRERELVPDSETDVLRLHEVGVYYSFPGYKEKIREHGFVGMEILHPQII